MPTPRSAEPALHGKTGVVLCWDIDGTLLTTARAGIGAWEQALLETLGKTLGLGALPTAGLTDVEIGRLLIERLGAGSEPTLLGSLLARYEALLPLRLHDRKGKVLPGVWEFLEWNREHDRVPCILLTGNTRAGAAAKLRHYGLSGFFSDGAFASLEDPDRVAVARKAVGIASGLQGEGFVPERMVVIGDTPHDVNCGRAVGARTLAVATGTYGVAELDAAGAWRTLEAIPEPQAFLRFLK